ncbi:cyclic nucleotide-binding domain-containing protein [Knoellia sp. 3-2P3]|uniref:cyclic nucleotide-binding domain-containing protein n=1 Tax=unclassified Knoellia TaxID=2618719 RepID=UPI0023DB05AB|nr:cyclic nucleotide-binding domain-containing protein [Knoellia sp. 3-2P3]MDF2094007.1 cyclic nucleotide-binding domain-containing protein [Knoellia sp. 3-2P3]
MAHGHPALPEMLKGIDLFAELPDEVILELVEAGSTIRTPGGHAVVRQGESDSGLQVVLEGTATVDVGGVRRDGTLGPGDYFGEISVIDGGSRSATITAGEDGLETFAVSPLTFWPLIDRHASLRRCLMKALCARIRALDVEASATC